MKRVIFLLVGLFVVGCAISPTYTEDQMYKLALDLKRLSQPVEVTVRYDNPPATTSDIELLKQATLHDPSLLTPFKDYRLRILREHRHAVLLLCSKDGKALLEDAGCTGEFERHRWKNKDQPCEFTLDIDQVCR